MFDYLKFVFSFWKGFLTSNSTAGAPSSIPPQAPQPAIVPSNPIVSTPSASSTPSKPPSSQIPLQAPPKYFKDVVARYGTPYNSVTQQQDDAIKNEWEHEWMTLWRSDIFEQKTGIKWPGSGPFKKIYCNKDLIPYLDRAFKTLIERDLFKELKTFDGCWNIRPIRGTTDKWSMHTFAVAIDLNAGENKLGGPQTFSDEFIKAWEDSGWTAGAKFKRIDPMHMQLPTNC